MVKKGILTTLPSSKNYQPEKDRETILKNKFYSKKTKFPPNYLLVLFIIQKDILPNFGLTDAFQDNIFFIGLAPEKKMLPGNEINCKFEDNKTCKVDVRFNTSRKGKK